MSENPNHPPGDDPPDLLGLRKNIKRATIPEAAPVEMDVKLAVALASIDNSEKGETEDE